MRIIMLKIAGYTHCGWNVVPSIVPTIQHVDYYHFLPATQQQKRWNITQISPCQSKTDNALTSKLKHLITNTAKSRSVQ